MNSDLISRQAAIDALTKTSGIRGDALKALYDLPPVTPSYNSIKTELEPCKDAISRQIISDYVESHIQEINTGYGDLNNHTNRILRMIVDYIKSMSPVTPQPCEDSIVEWKKDFKGYVNSLSMPRDDYNGIMEYIDELPVTPQPKMGQWIAVDKGLKVTSFKCSECGRTVRDDTGYDVAKDYPYCHCGAKMQEVEG